MRNFTKIISSIIILATLTVVVVAYICPMRTLVHSGTSRAMSNDICQITNGLNIESSPSCMSSHTYLAGQLISSMPQIADYILGFILLVIISPLYLFLKNISSTLPLLLTNKSRFLFKYYRIFIKLLLEKDLFRYLNFVGNYSIVSLV